jgi:hypothetical protein
MRSQAGSALKANWHQTMHKVHDSTLSAARNFVKRFVNKNENFVFFIAGQTVRTNIIRPYTRTLPSLRCFRAEEGADASLDSICGLLPQHTFQDFAGAVLG